MSKYIKEVELDLCNLRFFKHPTWNLGKEITNAVNPSPESVSSFPKDPGESKESQR